MLNRDTIKPARIDEDTPPLLIVVIDTEEEFDWEGPLSRESTSTESIPTQYLAQDIFARYGVIPTYVVDYPVATSEAASRFLRGYADQGLCEIGTHLHPWVSPPHQEDVNFYNSYAGNLPADLERAKLECLTDAITASFGQRPVIYKAGRYGVGANTTGILEDLGYKIDLSVVAKTWFTDDGGPDFSTFDYQPYWFGQDHSLLEIPLTASYTGWLETIGPNVFPWVTSDIGCTFRMPAICARLGLLERIRLTPEGIDFQSLKRLTQTLMRQGCRVFCMAYHSPSLQPGLTPYVDDEAGLKQFLQTIEDYLAYFVGDLGGKPTTPTRLYDQLAPSHALGRSGH